MPAWNDYREILKRQIDACADWKAFAERLSGETVPDFSMDAYQEEYMLSDEAQKDHTILGRFILAALAQKSMVTNRIYHSKNLLAGFSIDYDRNGFKGIRDFKRLLTLEEK